MSRFPRPYGPYVLLERLGSGGMSEVDLARKVVDGESFVRFLVIKRIKADFASDPSFVRMFKDEARITSELHHANIGAVYDFGKVDDEYYLALEHVAGMDARRLINLLRERAQRVPVRIALKIVVEVLEALEHAHGKRDTFGRPMNIVHRDVNPRNVMLSLGGEVKLIDFGVAKAVDRLEQTGANHVKGKYTYMSPEQLSGQAVDHRADVYAAGLLLHELLAGVGVFQGLNQVQVLHKLINGEVPAFPDTPEIADRRRLKRAHDLALAHQASERFQSAAAFAAELRAVAAPLGDVASNDELARFLAMVEPTLASELTRKMERYARPSLGRDPVAYGGAWDRLAEGALDETSPADPTQELRADKVLPPDLLADLERSGSRSQSRSASQSDSRSMSRTGLVAGSVVAASFGTLMIAVAVVLGLVAVAAFFLGQAEGRGAPAPPPSVPLDPGDRVHPPTPTSAPAPAAGVSPRSTPRPVARPPPPEPAVVMPEPAVVAPIPLPAPVPVPMPGEAPPPAPETFGYLNVSASSKGLVVRVDGEPAGVTALARHKVATGSHRVEVDAHACRPPVVDVLEARVVTVTCAATP